MEIQIPTKKLIINQVNPTKALKHSQKQQVSQILIHIKRLISEKYKQFKEIMIKNLLFLLRTSSRKLLAKVLISQRFIKPKKSNTKISQKNKIKDSS